MIKLHSSSTKSTAVLEITLSEPRRSGSGKNDLLATGRDSVVIDGKVTTCQVNIFTRNAGDTKLPKTIQVKVPLNAPRPSGSGKSNVVGVLRESVVVTKDLVATAQISMYQK